MKTKTVDVVHAAFQIKAAGQDDGLDEGVFTGYASVFGNVDSYGDIVQPGAFKDSLDAWRASDRQIPLLWGHDTYALDSIIGSIDPSEAVRMTTGYWSRAGSTWIRKVGDWPTAMSRADGCLT